MYTRCGLLSALLLLALPSVVSAQVPVRRVPQRRPWGRRGRRPQRRRLFGRLFTAWSTGDSEATA